MNWTSHEFIWLDWVVFAIGIACVIALVWRALNKAKRESKEANSEEFLYGKGEPWWVIGMAIFAANIGSEHLVGLAGTGALNGVGMAHWEMQGWMILILGWLFVPFYQLLNNKLGRIITMPEFLKYRYTKRTGTWLSVITLVAYILTKVSVTAYTGGIFFEYLLGLPFWYGALGLIIITAIFTIIGGMKGVMTMSAIQTPILIIGSFLVLFLGLAACGDGSITQGWTNMMNYCSSLHDGYGTTHMFHWSTINASGHPDPLYHEYPGFVVFLGASIIGFWYWCTDQHIVQRVLGQKKGEDNSVVMKRARRGTICAGYFKILPVFMFLIPGMVAATLASKGMFNMGDTDGAYAYMVKDILPAGVKGLVTVGFVCALVTSLAAFFNSCATLFTEDFYKPLRQGKSEAHYIFAGRAATVVIVIIGIIWIPVMMSLGKLYSYLQGIQSLLAPAMVAVFFLGIFFKKITPKAGEWGLIVGFLIGMVRLVTNVITDTGDAISQIKFATINHEGFKCSHGVLTDVWTHVVNGSNVPITLDGRMVDHLTVFTSGQGFWDATAWFWQTNWLVFECWLLVFIIAFMFVVSMFTAKPSAEQVAAITFTDDYRKQIRASWDWRDVVGSLGVLALCGAFYWYFF